MRFPAQKSTLLTSTSACTNLPNKPAARFSIKKLGFGGDQHPAYQKRRSFMQDDHGIKRILTLSWAYNLFQYLVGGMHARKWVAQHFWNIQSGQKIVDIGCGPASTVDLLPKGVTYIGFDISQTYISSALTRYAGDATKKFVVGVPEDFVHQLPEQMRDADLVVINGLLHHLDDDEALTALRLARTSLAVNGRLICMEPSFLLNQSFLARWVLEQDRGQNVRTEPEWKALVSKVFEQFDTYILTGLLRIPYSMIVIEVKP
jgi:SAM-dependent methyltransferase